VGDEVLHALLRGSRQRGRRAPPAKLAIFVQQAHLPQEVYDRIRRSDVVHHAGKEKEAQLVRLERFHGAGLCVFSTTSKRP